ncbi:MULTISPECIES: heme-binding protein [unclassified Mycobacterium]|uniref:heme-binding protein n=1 Tax=unclassified Mycobacterium TaxID=2642494 RepID=UPI0029C8BD53|nr:MULTISPECIES: heme-binding protein [unclassified Mycobacterium]
MKLFETSARRRVFGVAAASALAALALGVAPPSANAAPCAASGLATTASGVLADAGGYLDAHPGANDVLTAAANQPPDEARSNVRGYFTAHPGEFLDLQRITQPLKDLRSQCGIAISPTQLASLFEALS